MNTDNKADKADKTKKILIVQPSIQPPGGGNSVCAWIIEVLKAKYELHVLTYEPIDLKSINLHYATSIKESDIIPHKLNPIIVFLVELLPFSAGHLKRSLILRACKKMKQNFDLIITANNEADFGCPGIQYIHYPWNLFPRPLVDIRWYHKFKIFTSIYYFICAKTAQYSELRMKENLSLVNSNWTSEKLKACYPDIKLQTVYPPVLNDFPKVLWDKRENGFVCIGRISKEKEIFKIIDIVKRVRLLTKNGHLHIIGVHDDPVYYTSVLKEVGKYSDWLFLEENLTRYELTQLVSRHKFGIHGMIDEHFGISVAEMIAAECVVFAPKNGGQREIIGEIPELLYESIEDAVLKIGNCIQDSSLLKKIRYDLKKRSFMFSNEIFSSQIRLIVDRFVNKGI